MINCFDGKFAFLSNFYESFISDGEITYPTVEHYFQAMKTPSMEEALEIAAAPSPGRAKRLGKKCHLRADWEQVKEQVMEDGLRLKFADPELKQKLIDTYPHELIEGTTWHDNEWGNCSCGKCRNIPGKNKLGKMLMKLREEYMKEN